MKGTSRKTVILKRGLLFIMPALLFTSCDLRKDLPPDYAVKVCLRRADASYPERNRSTQIAKLHLMAQNDCLKQQSYCDRSPRHPKCIKFKKKYIGR
ncbi:MAG: hypothetical protein ACOX2O_08420 [Bdellovibrionota bacterium]|jgi:hypothetical protein